MGETEGRRPYRRLTEGERGRFLRVLRETGNRKSASAAIGVEARSMDQRRESDPELDRAWDEAVEAAHRRFAPASGPFDPALTAGGPGMIKRGKRGRLQLVASGEGRWSAAVEAIFLARLRECGCVRTAARAVGFNENSVWQRRRAWPGFAAAMEEMLEEAELALEFRLAAHANNVVAGEGAPSTMAERGAEAMDCFVAGAPRNDGEGDCFVADAPRNDEGVPDGFVSYREGEDGSEPLDCRVAVAPRNGGRSFDIEAAFRFLKWREEKRRGVKRGAPRGKPPSIEEVTEKIVRRVEAIKRHRRQAADGEQAGSGQTGSGQTGSGQTGGEQAGEGRSGEAGA